MGKQSNVFDFVLTASRSELHFRLCSDYSYFRDKTEKMCESFERRSYPYSMVNKGKLRAKEIDRETVLQYSLKEKG